LTEFIEQIDTVLIGKKSITKCLDLANTLRLPASLSNKRTTMFIGVNLMGNRRLETARQSPLPLGFGETLREQRGNPRTALAHLHKQNPPIWVSNTQFFFSPSSPTRVCIAANSISLALS